MTSSPTNLYLIFFVAFVFCSVHSSAIGLMSSMFWISVVGANCTCSFDRNITRGLLIILYLSPWTSWKLCLNFTSELERYQARVIFKTYLDSKLFKDSNYFIIIELDTPIQNFHVLLDIGSTLICSIGHAIVVTTK